MTRKTTPDLDLAKLRTLAEAALFRNHYADKWFDGWEWLDPEDREDPRYAHFRELVMSPWPGGAPEPVVRIEGGLKQDEIRRYVAAANPSAILSLLERLAAAERALRAVLLFHGGGGWEAYKRDEWKSLTGSDDATTKVLCDHIRAVLGTARTKEESRG